MCLMCACVGCTGMCVTCNVACAWEFVVTDGTTCFCDNERFFIFHVKMSCVSQEEAFWPVVKRAPEL
jgi:hypothetical protein